MPSPSIKLQGGHRSQNLQKHEVCQERGGKREREKGREEVKGEKRRG